MGSSESKTPTHEVVVVTGDKKGAGVDDVKLMMTFFDVGDKSFTQEITDCKHNDFKQREEAKFEVELMDLDKIAAIEMSRTDKDEKDTWYIDRIEVNKLASKEAQELGEKISERSIFPINRWLDAGESIKIQEYDSFLPHLDPNQEQRKKELRGKREDYMLSGKIIGAPPQVEILPNNEQFTDSYNFGLTGRGVAGKLSSVLLQATIPKFESLEDIESIYGTYERDAFPVPSGMKNWRSDAEFGHQKLAGCNPVLIELCKQIPDHLAVTDTTIDSDLLEKKTLQEALNASRMYIIDLSYLATIECTDDRRLPGPTCLFYQRDNGDLVPVAIQLMPTPAEDNPVFTPSDPEYTWLAAKMWFNLADCSHHQSVTHLGFTHLMMESVSVCANRRLSVSHPIYKLLAPHFLYIIAINSKALTDLVGPGGWVDIAMQIGRAGMFNIIKRKWAEWSLETHGNLKNDLKRRGVDAEGALPTYHYRDDALLLWDAIEKYVTAVIGGVYETEDQVKADYEIQAWVRELTESADFKGLPQKFDTKEQLIEVVTVFIFTSSVGHAAANFEQYDQYAFPPNYPSLIHGERPKNKDALSQDYVVDTLPTKKETLNVMEITKLLSEKATKSLGDFEIQYAYDRNAVNALERFRADLVDVEVTIEQRNQTRKRKYLYLTPKAIPNAISI